MKPAHLGKDDLALTVNHYQSRYSPDSKAGCSVSPYRAHHVEAQHCCLPIQIAL